MSTVKENQYYTHRFLGGIWLFHHCDYGISFEWIVEPSIQIWNLLKPYWLERDFLDENDGSCEEGYYFTPIPVCKECAKMKTICIDYCTT